MSDNVHQTNMFDNRANVNKTEICKHNNSKQLFDFVKKHKTPFEERNIKLDNLQSKQDGNRHSALYNFLGYSSKKAYEPISAYVNHFSRKGDLLFDPFSGSGGAGIVSSHLGRNCILSDISPLAAHISKAYCTYVNIEEIENAFKKLKLVFENVEQTIYGTNCHISGDNAVYQSIIWSQTYRCKKCFSIIPLKSTLEGNLCPNCNEEITTRQERHGYVLWGVNYKTSAGKLGHRSILDENAVNKEYIQLKDVAKADSTNALNVNEIGFVDNYLMNCNKPTGPWGVLWRPYHGEIRKVSDFFTRRNLYALQFVLNEIDALNVSIDCRSLLKLGVASIIPASSKQQRHYPGSTFPNMVMPGVLYVPPIFEEINVFRRFLSKKRSLLNGQMAVNAFIGAGNILVCNADSGKLNDIMNDCIDYIFTDPPYGGRIQYGELAFLQESILGFNTEWLENEIIINEKRGLDALEWRNRLLKIMQEAFRILKPGRWISVCFHDSDPQNWVHLQDIMAEAGFIIEGLSEASTMQTGWQTLKMHTSEDITKRDLVVNFKKPLPTEIMSSCRIDTNDVNITFSDKVRLIIRELLAASPGMLKDRIYDELVSKMVSKGQLEVHDFESLLSQVAIESREPVKKNLFDNEEPDIFGTHEISRWYLKETELAISDTAETGKEDEGARQIASFIYKKIKAILPDADIQKTSVMQGLFVYSDLIGVHYSDIFEHYIYAVKDKPRRQLSEWLLDYFYKTDDGTYRLPSTEEEAAAKAEGRSKGTNRRVKRYLALLEQGAKIPEIELPTDATLCEWIRHCKRAGSFEQGKILYEKGGLQLDRLSEVEQVEVEEDYQVCVRMLSRETGKNKPVTREKRKRSTS